MKYDAGTTTTGTESRLQCGKGWGFNVASTWSATFCYKARKWAVPHFNASYHYKIPHPRFSSLRHIHLSDNFLVKSRNFKYRRQKRFWNTWYEIVLLKNVNWTAFFLKAMEKYRILPIDMWRTVRYSLVKFGDSFGGERGRACHCL